MPLIGKILKKVVEVSASLSGSENIWQEQLKVLRGLLNNGENTAFGKHYAFSDILKAPDLPKEFASRVPIHTYRKMNEEWWYQQLEGKEDISWPGKPLYYATTAGTTGDKSKRLPVTEELLKSIRETGIKQLKAISHFDLPDSFFESKVLMLTSSTHLQKFDDHYEGEISGISASNIPSWFSFFYKPEQEISSIDQWDKRVLEIAKRAPDWDVGALSGIPSWVELMLKKVISYHKLKNIHEIWPNLSVYTTGGIAFGPYRRSMEKLFAHPLIYLDTYLASEGFLAYQQRPNKEMAMSLSYDTGIYFEFIPFEEDYFDENGDPFDDAPVLHLSEVEENKEYALIISSVAGAWRYSIGDTVKFTDKGRNEIVVSGRTKHFLNVADSNLSVRKLNQAVLMLEEKFHVSIPEFTVAALKRQENFIHKWYMGLENNGRPSTEEMERELDVYLQSRFESYKEARKKALAGVEIELVPKQLFIQWAETQKKKGGQMKISRVMKEELFEKWENFVFQKGV
jgi:hypothetical protein